MGKGQATSIDAIVAIGIVGLALIIIVGAVRAQQRTEGERATDGLLALRAQSIAQLLVATPGNPLDWERNASNGTTLGLASSPNVLDPAKVQAFVALPESTVQRLLNLPPASYYFALTLENGTMLTAGNATGYKSAAAVERLVLYGNTSARMVFRVQR